MKNNTFAIFVGCLSLLLLSSLSVSAQTTLRMVSDIWPPFVYGNADPNRQGYVVEIMKSIYESQGYTIDLKILSWDKAIAGVNDGEFDIIIGTDRSELPDGIFPEEAIGISYCCFFVLKGNPWQYRDLTSLKHVRLGCVKGYKYHPDIDRYISENEDAPNGILQAISSPFPEKENIEKLLAGKIDAIITSKQSMEQAMREMNVRPTEISQAGGFVKEWTTPAFVAFSPKLKNAKALADSFDAQLRRMRNDGSFDEILSKYLVNDWKTEDMISTKSFSHTQKPKKADSRY